MNAQRPRPARRMAVTGLLAALAVVLLWLAGVSEVASLSVLVLAGTVIAVAVVECGVAWGGACLVSSALLGLILSPDKVNAALYLLLFGAFPIVKALCERRRGGRLAEYAGKFLFANFVFFLLYLGARLFSLDVGVLGALPWWAWPLLVLLANGVLLLYDLVLTRLVTFYLYRIRPRLGAR